MHFSDFYKTYVQRINKKLYHTFKKLPDHHSQIIKSMKYSTLSSGKRLRAVLIYSIGKLLNTHLSSLDTIAIAIECIHAYSLIHDDLPCMDNSDIRRGKNACHVQYNEGTAVLSGDALQSLAFNILSTRYMPGVLHSSKIKMISDLSYSIGASGMCMGQMLDLEDQQKKNLLYLNKVNLYKTAFLMRSSVRLVYFASNNIEKSILPILDNFSISLGLAFQIQDDVIDFVNDSSIVNNKEIKKTYPQVVGIKRAKNKIKKLYEKILFSLKQLKMKNFDINMLKKFTQFIIKNNI